MIIAVGNPQIALSPGNGRWTGETEFRRAASCIEVGVIISARTFRAWLTDKLGELERDVVGTSDLSEHALNMKAGVSQRDYAMIAAIDDE